LKPKSNTIAICGASGFIGTNLSRSLVNSGYEVVRIGREHFKNTKSLAESLEGCNVVINLCGAPIAKKWNEIYKHELYVSRVETTRSIIKEISHLSNKPKLFISVSAVGIYKKNLVHDDDSTNFDTSYLGLLAKEWEQEAEKSNDLGLRSAILRLGIVLGKNGGALDDIKLSFKIGLGAIPGDGKQQFSWVHIDDVINVFKKVIEDETMQGKYNLVAPQSVDMKTFMKTFGKTIKKPVWLNVPEAIMKMRYGEGAESLLKGSVVVPKRLESEGYTFIYAYLDDALKSINYTRS